MRNHQTAFLLFDYFDTLYYYSDMVNEKNKATKAKRDIGYKVFYIIGISIICCIGFFGSSYFAYDFFNSLFFDILSTLLIALMLCVRSIQTFLRQTTLYGKIFTLIYYNLFALAFTVRPLISGRLWVILLFFSFIIAIILLIILAFKYVRAPNNYVITKYEPIIALLMLVALMVVASRQSYTGAQGMWIPVVICGIILSICALITFIKYFKNIDYFKEDGGELIATYIIIVALCFFISFTTIATVNYAFDDSSTEISVQVLDKKIQSGARTVTSYYFQIKIDETETQLDVPADVFHSTEVGEYIEIKLYNGALGYSYYIYEN